MSRKKIKEIGVRVGKASYEGYPGGFRQLVEDFNWMKEQVVEIKLSKLFVVTMYRWGDPEQHSYIIGAFTSRLRAEYAMKDEQEYRGGKYEGSIRELVLNEMYDREADISATVEQIREVTQNAVGERCQDCVLHSDCCGQLCLKHDGLFKTIQDEEA